MKFFIKIYSEGLDSSSSTVPFTLKYTQPNELTLADLRMEIECKIKQPQIFRKKNQLISVENDAG